MPVHDWTRVDAGIFHDCHTVWVGHLRTAFNEGLLPAGYYALAEQHAGQTIADVPTLPFELTADKPLTVAAYRACPTKIAYVEPVAVGDDLPVLPIFLTANEYVPAPLKETYRASWAVFPTDFKALLERPAPLG